MRATPLACLLATIAVLPGAHADDAPRRRLIEQKAALVQRVLEDSAMARRVASSGSDEARAQLAHASAQHRRALALAADGHLAASEAAIDEAMASIGRARKLAPDLAQLQADQRTRYEALLGSTQSLLAAARRQARAGSTGSAPVELDRGVEFISQAAALANEGRTEEAHRVLLQAERALLDALPRLLGTTTVDHVLRFESPAEELRYESERYDSFLRLVPIAIAQLKPAPDAVQRVDQYTRRAVQLHERAATQSMRGDLAAALDSEREATLWLQRALGASGLVIPGQR